MSVDILGTSCDQCRSIYLSILQQRLAAKALKQNFDIKGDNESAPTKGTELDLAAPESNALFPMNYTYSALSQI